MRHYIVAGFALLILVARFALAADTGGGSIQPEVTGIGAEVSIGDERFVAIYRQHQDLSNPSVITHYFHKPMLLFATNPTPINGYPPIVMKPPKTIDNFTYLTFKSILSSSAFRERVKAVILSNDPILLQQSTAKVDANAIRVDKWPILKMKVEVFLHDQTGILGTWISPSLGSAGPVIQFDIGFDDNSLRTFLDSAASGDIDFVFSYSYSNKYQDYATSWAYATKDINEALYNSLKALNLSVDTPIFQQQANSLKATLTDKISSNIVVTDPSLISAVQSQLLEKLISVQAIPIQSIQDEKLKDAIYQYLKPLIKTYTERRTQKVSTTDAETTDVGMKFKYGQIFEFNVADKDNFIRDSGLTLEQDTADQTYVPALIKVYNISTLSDQVTTEIVNRVFVLKGGNSDFEEDTPVRSDFTIARLGEFAVGQEESEFAGSLIQRGAIMAFDTSTCPPGWEEFNSGKGRFLLGAGGSGPQGPISLEQQQGSWTILLSEPNLPQFSIRGDVGQIGVASQFPYMDKPDLHVLTGEIGGPYEKLFTVKGGGGSAAPVPLTIQPPWTSVLYCKKR